MIMMLHKHCFTVACTRTFKHFLATERSFKHMGSLVVQNVLFHLFKPSEEIALIALSINGPSKVKQVQSNIPLKR